MSIQYWMRASLAGPPGKCVNDSDRSATYRAAMAQFEQLLDAAAATGYAARPLPLYYALAQGGRAIVASRGGSVPSSHGLKLTLGSNGMGESDLLATTVQAANRPGWFSAVADATDSPRLAGPASLGELMASLPECSRPYLSDRLLPARFVGRVSHYDLPVGPHAVLVRAGVEIAQAEDPSAVARLLRDCYPAFPASNWGPLVLSGADEPRRVMTDTTLAGRSIVVEIHIDARQSEKESFDHLAPEYRWVGRRWLRPKIAGGEPPTPLMTWWLLLFGLSVLARYHPVPWTAALDRSSSTAAVELERAMDLALDAVPHLVLEAISGRPVLMAPSDDTPPLTL